jgi:hypothetical protein
MTLTAETPIAAYNIDQVSRPVAAVLLGFSLKALNLRIAAGEIVASGRVKKTVAVAEVEAIRGRPVTVHEYLMAAHKPPGDRNDGRSS